MSDNPTSPLLGLNDESRPQRPTSKKSTSSIRSNKSQRSNISSEATPLLLRQEYDRNYGSEEQQNGDIGSQATLSLQSVQDGLRNKRKGRIRWPTIIALSILCLICVLIMIVGFATPAAVEEYAKEAMVFEPTKLSIADITSEGVQARIQGTFILDASRVQKKSVRDIGKVATFIAREAESKESKVEVYLPEYGNILVGTADVPPIKINIRNGHVNHVDFLSTLRPGDFKGIRQIAEDWVEGRLGHLRIKGVTEVGLKSGIFSLGTQSISESIQFESNKIPAIPQFDINKLNFHEIDLPDGGRGMEAEASISLFNDYPVKFTIPSLGFDILVPNCTPKQAFLLLAKAATKEIHVMPKQTVRADVNGIVPRLPADLTTACPNTDSSPLDTILRQYISGDDTTIFVRGSEAPSLDTPGWVSDLLKSFIVPVPFPGHTFDNLIKNFSLADVHFSLPDLDADPATPQARPRISAIVKALVGLPKEMNFPLDIDRVRANADVYYHHKRLGNLDLRKWQKANTTRIEGVKGEKPALLVQSAVEDAPLEITDDDVFMEVVQALIGGSKGVVLNIRADVDVETITALGDLTIRKIPGQGKIFVKPLSGVDDIGKFAPRISSLQILDTTKSAVNFEGMLNFTNPTSYSAAVPFVRVNVLNNDTILGHVTARDVSVVPGDNTNVVVNAVWEPLAASGSKGVHVGRELLSQYLSGFNTSLIFKTFEGTIPAQPALGKALSALKVELPAPKLRPPKDDDGDDGDGEGDDDNDEEGPHFIKDATMHLWSSTATFTLISPFSQTTFYITNLNATALYNHTMPVGTIIYDLPFAVPPGISSTPRLPVNWSLGSVGYEAVKKALGGNLKLDAKAEVSMRVGKFETDVWFVGGGIGAHVRI